MSPNISILFQDQLLKLPSCILTYRTLLILFLERKKNPTASDRGRQDVADISERAESAGNVIE